LLVANACNAENLTIDWWVTGWTSGKGFIPKIAASGGLTGSGALIYQTSTADATFKYWDGQMVLTDPKTLNWDGPSSVTSTTQPSPEVGHAPSIAMVTCPIPACRGLYITPNVIQVHQGGQDGGAALFYRTGVNTGGLSTTWAASQFYNTGFNPVVAVDQIGGTSTTTTVVEVHQAAADSSELWYHVGTLTYSASSVSVSWGAPQKTGFSGYAPTVSIAKGIVVLMAQGTAPQMWYSIGTVDTSTNTIKNWSVSNNYDNGYNPSVSVQTCDAGGDTFGCDFVLVEGHQEGKTTGSLMYRIGKMYYPTGGGAPTSIKWTPNADTNYAKGCYPSFGLMTYGTDYTSTYPLVESHSDQCGEAAIIQTAWGHLQLD
jgi:hypothetical protein